LGALHLKHCTFHHTHASTRPSLSSIQGIFHSSHATSSARADRKPWAHTRPARKQGDMQARIDLISRCKHVGSALLAGPVAIARGGWSASFSAEAPAATIATVAASASAIAPAVTCTCTKGRVRTNATCAPWNAGRGKIREQVASSPPKPPPPPPPGLGVLHLKHSLREPNTIASQLGQFQSPSRLGGPPPPPRSPP
jgi:hypothetical protein